MRQVGMFAAACSYALDHHLARLPEDHANARLLGERLATCPGVAVDLPRLMTNIVVFELGAASRWNAPALTAAARERGVLINALGQAKGRLVTHLDVTREDCVRAAQVLSELLSA